MRGGVGYRVHKSQYSRMYSHWTGNPEHGSASTSHNGYSTLARDAGAPHLRVPSARGWIKPVAEQAGVLKNAFAAHHTVHARVLRDESKTIETE